MTDLRGIGLPFRITASDADVATVVGDKLRETHVETILGTRASSAGEIGELAWDPDRGSALDALLNAANGEAVADFAALYAERAFEYALPDESVRAADVVVDNRTIELTIQFGMSSEQDRSARLLSVSTRMKR